MTEEKAVTVAYSICFVIAISILILVVSCSTIKPSTNIEDRMDLLEDWMFFIENDLLIENGELISLIEWDEEQREKYTYPRLNSIECPVCGEELYDSDGYVVYMGGIPRIRIMCNGCGYVGNRVK